MLDLVVKIPNPRVPKFDTEIFSPAAMKILFAFCGSNYKNIVEQIITNKPTTT